jgi:Cu-Zn family superoxide dismutase
MSKNASHVFSSPITRAVMVAATGIAIAGCKTNNGATQPAMSARSIAAGPMPIMLDDAAVTKAVATIGSAKSATTQPANKDVTGTVTFTLDGEKLKFVADIDGLAPNTEHGFHIHEKGDLSDPDLKSAGGHFNPTKEKHGGPESEHHHAGDLGNLKADAKGHAHLEGTVMHASFSGDTSILGRSVIIHAKADDLKTDPSGNSGGRVAGGVIKAG